MKKLIHSIFLYYGQEINCYDTKMFDFLEGKHAFGLFTIIISELSAQIPGRQWKNR